MGIPSRQSKLYTMNMNLTHLTLERIQITWRHSKSRINYRLISCLDLVDCQMTCHNVVGITIPRSRLRDQDTIIDTQQRVPRHKRKRNLQFKFQRMRIIFFAQTNNHVQLIVDKFCYCYVWPVCIGTEIFTPIVFGVVPQFQNYSFESSK